MRIPRYLQDNNPSQKQIEHQYDLIKSNYYEIERLQRELHHNEAHLTHLEMNQYVVTNLNETFWDHIADVEYTQGYYQTQEEAHEVGKAECTGGYRIFDLNGNEIFNTEVVL